MKMLAQGLSPFKHRADTRQALSDEAKETATGPGAKAVLGSDFRKRPMQSTLAAEGQP